MISGGIVKFERGKQIENVLVNGSAMGNRDLVLWGSFLDTELDKAQSCLTER